MTEDDGRHDFDFVAGVFVMHHRKLVDVLDPNCDEWVEFESVATGDIRLYGLANTDRMLVPAMPPHGQPFEGMTLRLFDPEERVWRIWWTSSRFPGRLDPPVVGRFTDGRGEFFDQEDFKGRKILVHYQWTHSGADKALMQQSFSDDGGKTWEVNWICELTRTGP